MLLYNNKLKPLARNLRNKSTLLEALLWNILKSKKMKGYQFYRQKPIDNYIVDFYCHKLKLIIEIDGLSHEDKNYLDIERQNKLESIGLTIIRFLDIDIKNNLNGVMSYLENWIEEYEKGHNPISLNYLKNV